ncbi:MULTISPECIES: hypothetical protein [unclassified Acetobacterium]|uniref:hypothetical protein n=1 Tax=unclassified Acetobacterium TaxID=2638182 RepID=UPI000DBECCE5|nr:MULTISPECIES: hypothetical protein [unclassified Acetobacterium]AWW25529.1 hypothetical protein DOZ58_02085 [Acetobacterium sp. KB-1]MDZ5726722.1 hypothetical protein [Acetobacterium sp. K1/6]
MDEYHTILLTQSFLHIKILSDQNSIKRNELTTKLIECKKIVELIGEPVIRNFYMMKIKNLEVEYRSPELGKIIDNFEKLDKIDQSSLIQYIVETKGVDNK